MKNTMIKRLTGLTLAALLLVAGCDFQAAEDAFDGFDIIIELEEINTNVSVRLINPADDSFINDTVNLTFKGDNGGDVIDLYSDPLTAFAVSGGIGAFGIKNAVVPSASNPVTVRVVAKANGFETGSANVVMTSTGLTEAVVYMVRSNQTVQGGATASGSGQATSGTVNQPVQVTTNSGDATNQATASVSVPTGTIATTASGVAATGTLQTNVSFYTAPTQQSSQAFPGGFSGGVQQQNGTVSPNPITTAGFMTVTVTDGAGNEVTQFDPPIELSIDVPGTTINPGTGAAIQNGETIDIMSYDDDNGIWVDEGEATLVGPGQAGNYKATFLTNHLSTWNAGYADNGCTVTFNINRNGNTGSIRFVAITYDPYWWVNTFIPSTDSQMIIENFPVSHQGGLSWTTILGGVTLSTDEVGDQCGKTITIDFPAPPPTTIDVTFSLDFGSDCSALKTTSISSYTVSYRKTGAPASSARTVQITNANFTKDNLNRITGGTVVVPGLEQGETYIFSTSFDGNVETRTETITGANMVLDVSADLDDDLCAS